MEPNRANQPLSTNSPGAPVAGGLDPRLLDALRAALGALIREGSTGGGAPVGAVDVQGDPPEAKTKPSAARGVYWLLIAALLLGGAAAVGVLVYERLTADFAHIRSELGELHRELGLVRTELVRKDEFNGRHLAANAMIREADASSKRAAESEAQRLQEHQQSLADLRLQLKDLQRDAERLRERLRAREPK
jgi:hypothetical protein